MVVPHRVLSELDGLKTSEDETRSVKARAAIRQLDATSSRIRGESLPAKSTKLNSFASLLCRIRVRASILILIIGIDPNHALVAQIDAVSIL